MSTIELTQLGPDDNPQWEIGGWDNDEHATVHIATISHIEALELFEALGRELGREVTPGVFATSKPPVTRGLAQGCTCEECEAGHA